MTINVLQYNQESAVKAGGGEYVSEGGAYIVTINEAKYEKAKTGTDGLEFSVTTEDGMKASYLRVYFAKKAQEQGKQGEPIKGGVSLLNAMMGILRASGMTAVKKGDIYVCPEFEGKKIGLFLQKVLYTKNDGSEGYKFEIVVPFHPSDRRTMREIVDNKPAQMVDRMTANYKDRVEKQQGPSASSAEQEYGFNQRSGGEDIPW